MPTFYELQAALAGREVERVTGRAGGSAATGTPITELVLVFATGERLTVAAGGPLEVSVSADGDA